MDEPSDSICFTPSWEGDGGEGFEAALYARDRIRATAWRNRRFSRLNSFRRCSVNSLKAFGGEISTSKSDEVDAWRSCPPSAVPSVPLVELRVLGYVFDDGALQHAGPAIAVQVPFEPVRPDLTQKAIQIDVVSESGKGRLRVLLLVRQARGHRSRFQGTHSRNADDSRAATGLRRDLKHGGARFFRQLGDAHGVPQRGALRTLEEAGDGLQEPLTGPLFEAFGLELRASDAHGVPGAIFPKRLGHLRREGQDAIGSQDGPPHDDGLDQEAAPGPPLRRPEPRVFVGHSQGVQHHEERGCEHSHDQGVLPFALHAVRVVKLEKPGLEREPVGERQAGAPGKSIVGDDEAPLLMAAAVLHVALVFLEAGSVGHDADDVDQAVYRTCASEQHVGTPAGRVGAGRLRQVLKLLDLIHRLPGGCRVRVAEAPPIRISSGGHAGVLGHANGAVGEHQDSRHVHGVLGLVEASTVRYGKAAGVPLATSHWGSQQIKEGGVPYDARRQEYPGEEGQVAMVVEGILLEGERDDSHEAGGGVQGNKDIRDGVGKERAPTSDERGKGCGGLWLAITVGARSGAGHGTYVFVAQRKRRIQRRATPRRLGGSRRSQLPPWFSFKSSASPTS
eukprot:scaffold29_cov251-Pinguiococcus_pyrenoidosus.AAC.44